ncbi:transposase family protein [Streptomyces sp. NPDC024089]|uniref:transposase family protein n=1 Tax=Streptomyces sp. NPDC024089 TaxID=3154328 RepID=UPI0033EE00B0
MARQDSRLRERRVHDRLEAEGSGPGYQLVFTDRMIAALVVLRFQIPHAALGVLYGVDRSTITRAVHEIRPHLAMRGFAVPASPDCTLTGMAKVGSGYRGLAKRFPDQVQAPPEKPGKDRPGHGRHGMGTGPPAAVFSGRCAERICVEHANAEHKQWRPLQRYSGRREYCDDAHPAIAGLVSDRTAMR